MVTLQGPTREALTQYVAEHRAELVQTFEGAERDRSIAFANKFNQTESGKLVREKFGVEMKIPKGYILAQQSDDFLWFRYEFPAASQGFMLYSYPYEGKQSLSEEALLAARNRFAARIPGPSDGSYMTTSKSLRPGIGFPARRQSLGRNARILGCRRGFHGRSVRKLYDRRYGDRPGFHAGLLCLFSETSQTQLYARSGTLASSGEIPRSDRFRICDCHRWQAGGGKSDAPASRDANPKPEAISSES